jgi:hypothetical protein
MPPHLALRFGGPLPGRGGVMDEPNVLDATIPCPDCCGSGEAGVLVAAGYFGHEGQDVVKEECPACHGSGDCRLGDLEAR